MDGADEDFVVAGYTPPQASRHYLGTVGRPRQPLSTHSPSWAYYTYSVILYKQ